VELLKINAGGCHHVRGGLCKLTRSARAPGCAQYVRLIVIISGSEIIDAVIVR
jgi:hypothetical protein